MGIFHSEVPEPRKKISKDEEQEGTSYDGSDTEDDDRDIEVSYVAEASGIFA